MRRLHAALAGVALALGAPRAPATPTARLVYSRAPGAESCPDEDTLRRAVASRVGYDPFFAWADKTIVASMAPAKPAGFSASVALVDSHGTERGTRALRTSDGCDDLVGATALAIAIAIDPSILLPSPTAAAPPPPAEPPPPPAPASAVPEPRPPRQVAPPADSPSPARLSFEASAGGVATLGVAPLPVAGAALGVAVRARRLSVAIEGRIDAPSSTPATGGGRVSSWMAVAALVPCGHAGPLFACGLGQAGLMQASSEGVTEPRSTSLGWLAAGGRFGVEVPLEPLTMLRVRSDLVVDLAPPTFELNGVTAWVAPRVAASFGADVVAHF
jgi:hypothetical protein